MAYAISPPSPNSRTSPSKSPDVTSISSGADRNGNPFLPPNSSAMIDEMDEKFVTRGLDMQRQLVQAHEDLNRADHAEAAEQVKQVAEDVNLSSNEALLASREADESRKVEKECLKDFNPMSNDSEKKRDRERKIEIESTQKQHISDVEALPSYLAIEEKNKGLREANDARIAAEANAKQVKDLSSEISYPKELLKTANVSSSVAEKLSACNVEIESSKVKKLLVSTSSNTDQRRTGVERSEGRETESVERASKTERLEESLGTGFLSESKMRIDILEKELEKAKESEAKMLESLISQTQQCEETKVSLAEAKIEIASLHENIERCGNKNRDLDGTHQCPEMAMLHETVKMLKSELQRMKEDLACSTEREELALSNTCTLAKENSLLKDELKSAIKAEEKSKRAMDDLALALTEVTMETKQVNEKLASAQSELEKSKMEAEHSKLMTKRRKEKYRALVTEARKEIHSYKETVKTLKQEAEEFSTSWNRKETGLVDYIKKSEEEIARTKEQNRKLIEALEKAAAESKTARVEIRNLRDIVKQAISEAMGAKEAAEIARTENSQLKVNLSDMSSALESITNENKLLKGNLKADFDNENEVKSDPHATASTSSLSRTSSVSDTQGIEAKTPVALEKVKKISSEQQKTQNVQDEQHEYDKNRQSHVAADSGVHDGPSRHLLASQEHGCSSEQKAPTLVFTDNGQKSRSGDFDHIGGGPIDDIEIKTKALLQRFGNLLRKSS